MLINYFVHGSSIVDEGAVIGDNTKIWHYSHIMSKAIIGSNCIVGQNVFIADNVIIGNNVKIQNNVSLYDGVVIEDDVFIGPSAVFTNVINPRSTVERKAEFKKTIVKKGSSIGANATIVCGNTIGSFSMIGAGAVVINDVLDYEVIVGNPAKSVGWISEYGCKLDFVNNKAICTKTGINYILDNGIVKKLVQK